MAAGSSNYWEDLRKQARQLENELDLKLVSFSKLCTSYSHSSTREGRRDRYSSDTTPLLNGSSQDRMFETMAVEIEQLLGRLTGINDKMAEYTNSAGVPSLNAALMHTLQRHRDILQLRSADRRNNKHCYGNKRKYDFAARDVEVNTKQNEHLGQSVSRSEQSDSKAQPTEATGLSHPGRCYWHLYHLIVAICFPLMDILHRL
ncbi:Golgi SNAP receptor complex member 1 isoform X3 [Pelodiscus sinensis]|uniref:Golgi SNAP receptor complex member 1 isoform X3 n=1 Tax=Pelodiscus sinensis TaxID=13735 RepID=UPI003F6B2313